MSPPSPDLAQLQRDLQLLDDEALVGSPDVQAADESVPDYISELSGPDDDDDDDGKLLVSHDQMGVEKTDMLENLQSIGKRDESGKYIRSPECYAALRYIYSSLADAGPDDRTRMYLGNYATMQSILIPLVSSEPENPVLFSSVLTILALLMKPIEDGVWMSYKQMHFLQVYKQAFIKSDIFAIVMFHIKDVVAKETLSRTAKERTLLSTAMVFILRVLAVPDDEPGSRPGSNDFESMQDRLILVFHRDNVLDCIRYLAETESSDYVNYSSNPDPETNLPVLLLSCIYFILKAETPKGLFAPQDDASGRTIQKMLEQENFQRRANARSARFTRHSRFGGTVKVAAIGGCSRFVSSLNFDRVHNGIEPKATVSRRQRIHHSNKVRRTLLDFCNDFLTSAFNGFVFNVFEDRWIKANLREEIMHNEMRPIISQLLSVLSFFLQFHRQLHSHENSGNADDRNTFSIDLVRICFEPDNLSDACRFMMRSSKNIDWDMIETSVAYYKELLQSALNLLEKGDETEAFEVMHIIHQHHECRFALPSLLKRFNTKNFTAKRSALLINSLHIQLKALQKSNNVERRARTKRRRKKRALVEEELSASDSDDSSYEFDRDVELNILLQKCVNPKIVTAVMAVLRDYQTNSSNTNSSAVKIIHRIAISLPNTPMLYQVSYMMLFQSILSDTSIRKDPAFRELRVFCRYIVKMFFSASQLNPSLVMEALFPISRSVAEIINDTGDSGVY